jgi:hypothetical protein
MAETITHEYQRNPIIDETWEILKKFSEEFHQGMKELREQSKETDRQMKETDQKMKETERILREQMKETDRRIGKLGNRFGEMVEYMVKPNLLTRFQELGFAFDKVAQQVTITDKVNKIFTEIDMVLEDGDKAMLVEVKSKPSTGDISEHVERMAKVRAHADLHGDRRKFLGAVAGMIFNENEKQYALKNGFYVLEPSGETFNITIPDGIKEW